MKSLTGPNPASSPRPAVTAKQYDRAGAQARAIALLAEDILSDEQIAADVGVPYNTLKNWKTQAPFASRLTAARERLDGAALRVMVARKYTRMQRYQDILDGLQTVLRDRARTYVDDLLQQPEPRSPIPGAATGYLVPGTAIVDKRLIESMLAVMKQAAVEANQWNEGNRAPISISVTVRSEAERLAARLGIPVEDLILEAESILLEVSTDGG